MAQKRMLDKKISVSEQVANLSDKAKLVFTWAIPHSDDVGLLPHSYKTLKALIVPMMEVRLEDFVAMVNEIVEQNLWQEFEYNGEKFWRIVKFKGHQTLKKDRQPQTILPIVFSKKPKDTWKTLEDIGFQVEDDGIHLESEVKRSEEKVREDKSVAVSHPKNETKEFFESPTMQDAVIQKMVEKGIPQPVAERELKKFISYWTELNATGKKQRWEKQETFEVMRRLATWFGNMREFQGANKPSKFTFL